MKTEGKPKKNFLSVKTICYCALFVALSVVANIFTVYLSAGNSNALSFSYTVCFLSGALFGPVVGFITGLCGDVLGWVINPIGGAFNPVIALVSGLIGLISGFTFWVAKRKGKEPKNLLLTAISYVLILLVCSNLNTVAIYFYYMSGKYSFWAYYAMRMPMQVAFWAINLAISLILIKPVKKIAKV